PWLWEQLVKTSQPTQQMGFIVAPGVADLARHRKPSTYIRRVEAGSEIILEMTLVEPANLTLLARETDGTVVCFCPSAEYAPKSHLSAGIHQLPQPQQREGTYQTFAVEDIGREQWLALLTPQKPPLDWLEQSRWETLELQQSQLQEMFEYVNKTPQARLLYTEYEVV
ncbi:MAG: hypothetical protein ACP5E4_04395, partial [Candidatus Aenigmatarchaeota archaeon]